MGLLSALALYDTSRHLETDWRVTHTTNQIANTEEPAHQSDQSQRA